MLAWCRAASVDQKSQEVLGHKYKFGDNKRKKVDGKSTQPDKTRYEKPRHGRRAKTPDDCYNDNRNKKSTTAHEMATDEDTTRAETTDDESVVYKKVKQTTNDTKNNS
jgi:hypothetical protein